MMQGVFLGLPLPQDQIDEFAILVEKLKQLALPVRFQKNSTPHVTLLYLGQIHEEKVAKVLAKTELIAQSTPAFDVQIGQVGYFGSTKHPRVVWLGVDASPQLALLQSRIRQDLGVHCSQKDERPFHAHLTIARIDSAKKFLAAKQMFDRIAAEFSFGFKADKIRIYFAKPLEKQRQLTLQDFPFTG